MMKKAIVVGSGIAGIASAIRLQNKGYQTTVFEANAYPGGKLSELRLKGYRFDAGPSLFTLPEKVDELFELSGKKANQHFKYRRLDTICNYFFSDKTRLSAYADKDKFIEEAHHKTGINKNDLDKHIKKSAFIYDSTAHLFINKSLHKLSSYLNFKTVQSIFRLPFLNIFDTMNSANRKLLKNDKMVQLFNRYATYNGSNPYLASGILNIIPHLEYELGAYLPEKGMHDITNSLVKLANEIGVKFKFEEKVEEIVTQNQRAIGVKVKSELQKADLIVCNMDITPAYKNLLPNHKPPIKSVKQEPSSSALIFYWGIKKEFPELDVHNIFFSENYKKEFEAIFEGSDIVDDPTVYVNITSKKVRTDAPEGKGNWFVMINVPYNNGQNWERLIEKARQNIISKLSQALGENIADLIEVEEQLDPITIESKTGSNKGALYGSSSNSKWAAFFRHPNFSKRIKNLYFVGGSVHPGGGIPLALSSAKIMSDLVKPASK